ncbi:hypothetical protein SAMN04487764_1522 [Gillisia sp. Hel1_33_143]|uniref:hypothetical protein n=1 Tax=Gillisia sp. Hel1_33_143 TaxID=1336796 RepID=UPI00087BDAB2|nr:hypothetical protein [Gillisia sp. Hel1_33_143]SDS13016.1 hypothetical protein SAMN04487764_1522 [Gillisia sp. Hel1_33_143]
MTKKELITGILQLGEELETAQGFGVAICVDQMYRLVEKYSQQLEFSEVGKAKRPIICGCNQPNVDNTTTPPQR